jgi:hypothetical protein
MDPILQAIMSMLGGAGTGLSSLGSTLFSGMGTGATGGISPAIMMQLQAIGFTPAQIASIVGSPAGGPNPGLFTSIGGALDPSNPMTGLLRLISGASMLPFAGQGETAINKGMNLLENPAAFASLFRSLAKPLNAKLVNSLKQIGGGEAAEAGLGQSAGAIASATDKVAAPYVQGNLENAQQTAMAQIAEMLQSGNLPGSPYANIARMFTGGSPGGDLGF